MFKKIIKRFEYGDGSKEDLPHHSHRTRKDSMETWTVLVEASMLS